MRKNIFTVMAAAALLLAGCRSAGPSAAQQASQASQASQTSQLSQAAGGAASVNAASAPAVEGNPVKLVPVQAIDQNPELPTGCEVTSLTVALNYYQIDIDKCDIADNYIAKGPVGTVNFRKAFEGDPRDENSFGCYAPVIVETANRILTERGSDKRATEVSGMQLEALYSYLDRDVPVIIWGTLDCEPGQFTEVWNVDGEELQWYSPEHCMVLAGYSVNSVWVADPMKGAVVRYDKEQFRTGYDALFKQAVVIE